MSKIRPQQSDQGPNTRVYCVPGAPTATTGGDNRPDYYRALHMWATQHETCQGFSHLELETDTYHDLLIEKRKCNRIARCSCLGTPPGVPKTTQNPALSAVVVVLARSPCVHKHQTKLFLIFSFY